MSDDLDSLDELLADLRKVLGMPGGGDDSPEESWSKLDLMDDSMGSDALRAILFRQGMSHTRIDDALAVLASRREAKA